MNQPYDHYKPSGIDWLGDIPSHWEVKKLKHLVEGRLEYGANESAEHDNVEYPRYIRITDFGENGKLRDETFKSLPPEVAEEYLLREGDVLFARSGATVGKTFQFKDYKGFACFAGYLIRATPDENLVSSDFLYLFTKSFHYENWKSSIFSQATIQNIGADKYNTLSITIPPLAEQRAIADYLDRKTAQIDQLVARKEQLLALLQKKRQAIINEAVTRGLDANAPKKDSGIEWLGKIPAHWRITKLKHLTTRIVDGTHFTPNYIESGVPFLRVTDIQSEIIDLTLVKYISQEEHEQLSGRCKPERGDVLLSKNGTIGITKVVDWDWEFSIFVSLCLIKLTEELNPRYFSYFFESDIVDQQTKEGSKTTSVTNLHLDKIKELLFALPPINEQLEIIEFLNKRTGRITLLERTIKTQLAHLKTYRQSLISEVVTGKVDVRAKVSAEL